MCYMESFGKAAKVAASSLSHLSQDVKNQGLQLAADELIVQTPLILEANAKDIQTATDHGMKPSLVDRLRLTLERVEQMAVGLRQIADLPDPIGEVLSMKQRPNGLRIGVQRVPLGVVGIIYESRPNVTADAFGLCLKTGNAALLRGGTDAIWSNLAIVHALRDGLKKAGITENALLFVEDPDRKHIEEMLRLRDYIDVLIPRGGKSLIDHVVNNSTVPVIETGTGNCHIYVDEFADIPMAVQIIENAKTQRTGVCNACESLVIHEKIAEKALPAICECLQKKNVEIRGDKFAQALVPDVIVAATEEDWGKEYLDLILSVKVVSSLEEAIQHINQYNTGHSESIITENYHNALKFQEYIDAAAVYVNASTRFTDGFEFGFGAEIGISTQKLHARGPMGLEALTTTKYIIFGDGQIRE